MSKLFINNPPVTPEDVLFERIFRFFDDDFVEEPTGTESLPVMTHAHAQKDA